MTWNVHLMQFFKDIQLKKNTTKRSGRWGRKIVLLKMSRLSVVPYTQMCVAFIGNVK